MKIIFKRSFMLFSLVFLLILSLGLVSASNDLDFIDDMGYADGPNDSNLISDLNECNHYDLSDCKNSDYALEDSNSNDLRADVRMSEKTQSANEKSGFDDIQDLIDNAKENDEIQISGTYLGDSPIIINKSLTLKSASGASLDGCFLTEIMIINAPHVVLNNINFINGNYTALAINSNYVSIENCLFDNNINGELGSAVSVNGDYFTVSNSSFTNNVANKSSCHHTDGAAIHLIGNFANITGCSFENNWGYNYEAASSGGAVWIKGNNININNSRFINNSAQSKFGWTLHGEEETYLADGLGGSIYITGNRINILNSLFVESLSHAYGGALYYKSAYDCMIHNSTFINSTSIGDGGVIYLGQNVYRFSIGSCSFINNTAKGLDGVLVKYSNNGSVIYSDKYTGEISIDNSSLLNNEGTSSIYFKGSDLNLSNSIIENDGLSAAVIFTNGSLNNNFWSQNFYSEDEFNQSSLIIRNGENYLPDNWVNLRIDGLDALDEKGDYQYNLSFALTDGELDKSLPRYSLNLRNSAKNIISPKDIILENNNGNFIYSYAESAKDVIEVYDDYENLILSKEVLSGIIQINDSGNDTNDLANAIDNAEDGALILLLNKTYVLDTISIKKNISIAGSGNTSIKLSNASNCIFNIGKTSEGIDSVRISDINFILDNGDLVALAEAVNSTNPLAIDVPEIIISNNNFAGIDDGVVGKSITVLQLDSDRAILAPTNDIVIANNSLESGMNPFDFNVKSISDGNDVKIDIGGNLQSRASAVIICKDMNTKAIYAADSRSGEYFNVSLKDSEGNVLANKSVQIGFNGKVYNRTTNLTGEVNLQINLPKKGTYTFAVSFLGDDEYNASFEVVKIIVDCQTPSLTAGNVKYKLNAKAKTISVSLKSVRGTAIIGKKISFSLNGKTYAATTNSKGIASVKVSLNKKGTYKFTAKFQGDNTFAAVSKSAKIVIV